MRYFNLFLKACLTAFFSLALTAFILVTLVIIYLEARLPSIEVLNTVQMQLPLRIYTADNQLIGTFGEKRRIPVTLEQVPRTFLQAILATEDQRFFEHSGVDFLGLARAGIELIRTGTKSQGASTITMQVARNFFLTRKKTFLRKLNEILLAIKIDQVLSKNKILELYLNKIYFGNRAYGVAAAAEVYYGKTLDQLTLPEMAMLAGIPKAPSSLNPLANPKAALERRNHVLERMLKLQLIDKNSYEIAIRAPITASYHQPKVMVKAPYAAEMARQIAVERFGEDAYTNGLQVYTTIDSQLQMAANQALRDALINYDKRHGYRGSKVNLRQKFGPYALDRWQQYLLGQHSINGLKVAAVVEVKDKSATALVASGERILLPWAGMKWTGRSSPHTTVRIGDVIRVALQTDGTWRLAQVPRVEGAIVVMNPKDGALKALVGGFDFAGSSFNRATQATRQAGSSFKPFIYSAALEKGFTLASIINDAPIVIYDPSLPDSLWRPQNDTRKFYGPTRLRVALAHSRNLVTIRLLQAIGIPYALDYLQRFGFDSARLPHALSMALGTADMTPLQLTAGYAVFANGGYQVSPYIIQRVADAESKPLLTAQPKVSCADCANKAEAVITPQNAYLMTSGLQEVIQHGTGHAATQLNRTDLAGKTGTSDDMKDAWFIGYNPDLLAGAWVGFDQPHSTAEHGSQAALPMWIEFMELALKGQPEGSWPIPSGIVTMPIDPDTGALVDEATPGAITEFLREDDIERMSAAAPSETSIDEGSADSAPLF